MSKMTSVGISDMKIAKAPGELITYALGSCVGICLYDPHAKIGGMVHIMLPRSINKPGDNVFKYADTGIQEMIKRMVANGAMKSRMKAKIAGGAKMFDIQDNSTLGNIGQRNVNSVKFVLKLEGIPIVAEDCGENYARTMSFFTDTGSVKIKTFGRAEKQL